MKKRWHQTAWHFNIDILHDFEKQRSRHGGALTVGIKRSHQGEFTHLEECLLNGFVSVEDKTFPISDFMLPSLFWSLLELTYLQQVRGGSQTSKTNKTSLLKKICRKSARRGYFHLFPKNWWTKPTLSGYDPKNIFNAEKNIFFL